MTHIEMINRLVSLRVYAMLKAMSDDTYSGWSQDVYALAKAIDILSKMGDEEEEK